MDAWGRLPGDGEQHSNGIRWRGGNSGGFYQPSFAGKGRTTPRAYVPPKEEGRTRMHLQNAQSDGAAAAAALEILHCDPESLIAPSSSIGVGAVPASTSTVRSGERSSAAKLARERYAEALSAKAPVAPTPADDLIDLGTSTAGGSSDLITLDKDTPSPEQPSGPWPGDVVLARYGIGGKSFYRARVVRVYSNRGSALVDVEWLRPPDGVLADRYYAWWSGADETKNKNGLHIENDLQSLPNVTRGSVRSGGEAAVPADAATKVIISAAASAQRTRDGRIASDATVSRHASLVTHSRPGEEPTQPIGGAKSPADLIDLLDLTEMPVVTAPTNASLVEH
eukprot:TRINITY_DN61548_c0_g1_i1.p1 TRINITY_DN61548_c0_g1~~TRINITY_DN61548_c0_g1_i1.p1  ORF type:complete len:338 (-),score=32.37 TRINITY_DN61548_c0_g1_i1:282-1295(-)